MFWRSSKVGPGNIAGRQKPCGSERICGSSFCRSSHDGYLGILVSVGRLFWTKLFYYDLILQKIVKQGVPKCVGQVADPRAGRGVQQGGGQVGGQDGGQVVGQDGGQGGGQGVGQDGGS